MAARRTIGASPVRLDGLVPGGVRIVLASGSAHRARLLRESRVRFEVDPPDIDERLHDHLLHLEGAASLALELARRKAAAVAGRHPGTWVVAADQVGVVGEGRDAHLLSKCGSADAAVEQLMRLQGGTHRLVNGVVLMVAPDGPAVEGLDEQVVRMRSFGEPEARRYVDRFAPFDSAGSYRLEDEATMERSERLLESVVGEDPSGVVGLPLPLMSRMFAELAGRVARPAL
jgi:septum formation protein